MLLSPTTESIALDQILERLGAIALQLHQFADLDELLSYGVQETREVFGGDRAVVYQLLPDGDGVVIAEAVDGGWLPIMGQLICDPCLSNQWFEPYLRGRVSHVDDVSQSALDACHLELLTQIQVKANLVAPIVINPSQRSPVCDAPLLWGLLIVHQCSAPRHWQPIHIQAIKQLAAQMGVALHHLKVQEHLKQTQRQAVRWQTALEGAEDGVWDWNNETNEVFFSERWKAMLGYEDHEIGNHLSEWDSRVHPDDRQAVYADLQKHFTGQTSIYQNEHRVLTKDGTWKWVLDRGKVVAWGADGTPLRMVGTHVDITERYLLEQHLRDRDEMLQKISQQVPGVVYQYRLYPDGHCCFPYTSEAIRQIYEVTPDQVCRDAQIVLERLHPDDREAVTARIQKSFRTLKLWHDEYRVCLPERGMRWLEGHAVPEKLVDGSVLWHGYIWDITERKYAEALMNQELQRERMLHLINHHIRESLNLQEILQTTVEEVRRFLNVDRVVIYRFQADWRGVIAAESVAAGWSAILDRVITDSYFVETQGSTYHDNHVYAVADVYAAGFSDCHIELLEWLQVRAKLVVPIVQGSVLENQQPWGLLIAHHCQGPREWQVTEGRLLKELASQLAIAIQQSELYQRVQTLNTTLEGQILKRTAELQQALHFESLLKRITDKVRDSLDEQQILQTVVAELASGLTVEACDTGIYNAEQTTSTIAYEVTNTLSSVQGHTFAIAEAAHPEVYPFLLRGEVCQFCSITPNPLRSGMRLFTTLVCPIQDENRVLGDLWLFKSKEQAFNDLEVRLVRQVANQCAIALRQSRLYQSAQVQVQELDRLNQLKDDFLSTVSHELRTPMATIKMATQMLEAKLLPLGLLADPASSISRYFNILKDEEQREINLINDLLDLTRLDAETEPLDLVHIELPMLIPHIAEPFIGRTQERQQVLKLNIPDDLPPLTTDPTYLQRCVTELLDNACKYTPPGEQIELSIQATKVLSLSVSNSGIEIPEAERDRIFDKFYRIPSHDPWKHGGTGLGLALVKKIVYRLGGTLSLDSVSGRVTFTIRFAL
ncbi:MAG: GAF domain-containing protein [Synechococcales bacterium]|nr:GAF domain-containing protein [Synechococcales bacterium]